MVTWNLVTVIVFAVVVVLLVLAVRQIIRDVKSGNLSCGGCSNNGGCCGGCSGCCSGCHACHSK